MGSCGLWLALDVLRKREDFDLQVDAGKTHTMLKPYFRNSRRTNAEMESQSTRRALHGNGGDMSCKRILIRTWQAHGIRLGPCW